MATPVRVDWRRSRVWVLDQRIHHGPLAIPIGTIVLAWALRARHSPAAALGAAIATWGLADLHDVSVWFVRGPQILEP
jgi:hypothetical protein